MKNFISLHHFNAKQLNDLVKLSVDMKKNKSKYFTALKNQHVGICFQKPSLRTKTAFCIGALELGANILYYSPDEIKLGKREKISDAAQVMSRYLHALVLRTFGHEDVVEFTKYAKVPIVNGLSDKYHPSQALADVMTIVEHLGDLKNLKIAYIGDGNNVCNSLMHAFAIMGGNLFIATPKGYEPDKKVMADTLALEGIKGTIAVVRDAREAVKDADVLYTDVWTSMGQEDEARERRKLFQSYQINQKLLNLANKKAIVMHCLPAHRGEEITDEVMDGTHSVVFDQAENRLHTAKAILYSVMSLK
jgi:ornithine carbamoyltransferase